MLRVQNVESMRRFCAVVFFVPCRDGGRVRKASDTPGVPWIQAAAQPAKTLDNCYGYLVSLLLLGLWACWIDPTALLVVVGKLKGVKWRIDKRYTVLRQSASRLGLKQGFPTARVLRLFLKWVVLVTILLSRLSYPREQNITIVFLVASDTYFLKYEYVVTREVASRGLIPSGDTD